MAPSKECTASSSDCPASSLPDCPSRVVGRSTKKGSEQVNVYFRNEFKGVIQCLWVDFQGREKPFGFLHPGQDRRTLTYPGHVWRFRENTEENRLVYETEVSKEASTFIIPHCRLPDIASRTPHFPHGPYPFISQFLVVLLIWYLKCYKKKAATDASEKEEGL
jgi:hypothetical protein